MPLYQTTWGKPAAETLNLSAF